MSHFGNDEPVNQELHGAVKLGRADAGTIDRIVVVGQDQL